MIIGLGIDIVECDRINEVGVERLATRILTKEEHTLLPSLPRRRLEFVAGRFAAKEAISKALGTGIGERLSFLDIQIFPDTKGKPEVTISEEVLKCFYGDQRVKIHLSITHSNTLISAVAIVEDTQ